MNTSLTSRIPWIDVCRGIAIILVLYGHALANDTQRFLIYAFHMPLFFFLSGIVFRLDKSKHFFSVILKNVRSILLPYFLFAVLTFIASYIILQPQTYTYESFTKQLYGMFYGNGNKGYLAYNVALWFLPCLFLTKIAFAFLSRFITNKGYLIPILIGFSLIGYGLSVFYPALKLFFGLETALTAFVFYGAGYLWNQSTGLKTFMMQKKVLLFGLTLLLTLLFAWLNFYFYGTQIDMRMNRMNNYFLFYFGAFSGIAASIIGSMLIKKNALLEYFGKHSLVLFVWHTMLFTYFRLHAIPPIKIEFVSPTLYLIQAAGIILFVRVFIEKMKAASLAKLSNARG